MCISVSYFISSKIKFCSASSFPIEMPSSRYKEVHEILIFEEAAARSFKCFETTVALVYYCTSFLKDLPYRDHRDVVQNILRRKEGRTRKTRNSVGCLRLAKKRADSLLSFCQIHPSKHFICVLRSRSN